MANQNEVASVRLRRRRHIVVRVRSPQSHLVRFVGGPAGQIDGESPASIGLRRAELFRERVRQHGFGFGEQRAHSRAVATSAGYPSATFAYDRHGNRQGSGFTYYPGNPYRLKTLGGIGDLTYELNRKAADLAMSVAARAGLGDVPFAEEERLFAVREPDFPRLTDVDDLIAPLAYRHGGFVAIEMFPDMLAPALLVIAVAFIPIFTLVDQEGRLFKPLAFTKTYSMGFAALLAVTVTPALAVLLIRGRVQRGRRELRHRLILTPEAELDGLTPDDVIQQTLNRVPIPR